MRPNAGFVPNGSPPCFSTYLSWAGSTARLLLGRLPILGRLPVQEQLPVLGWLVLGKAGSRPRFGADPFFNFPLFYFSRIVWAWSKVRVRRRAVVLFFEQNLAGSMPKFRFGPLSRNRKTKKSKNSSANTPGLDPAQAFLEKQKNRKIEKQLGT